jgi:NhaA family Na+:H+ antiporter
MPGIVLLLCAVAALVVANSPLAAQYQAAVHYKLGASVGGVDLRRPVEWWINDGLMAVFFFTVGLEIKREIIGGELRSARAAALPVIAAVGGMVVPGLVYAACNWGQPTVRGWGVPTATDIAFALGVLALLGKRVPSGLRVFLATLAIADDIGALLVIALFYTERLALGYLVGACAVLGVMVAMNRAGVRSVWGYLALSLPLWWLVYCSGVHATIAGVMAALTIPGSAGTKGRSPLESLEHALASWVSYGVLPLFAVANAGVTLNGSFVGALGASETLGTVLGLAVGKPAGITACSWLALKSRLGTLPAGVSFAKVHAAAWIAGIGFTMSLFIGNLAFPAATHAVELDHVKLGVLTGSAAAGVVGLVLLAHATRVRSEPRP